MLVLARGRVLWWHDLSTSQVSWPLPVDASMIDATVDDMQILTWGDVDHVVSPAYQQFSTRTTHIAFPAFCTGIGDVRVYVCDFLPSLPSPAPSPTRVTVASWTPAPTAVAKSRQ